MFWDVLLVGTRSGASGVASLDASSSDPSELGTFYRRATPDAPECLHDQRRCKGQVVQLLKTPLSQRDLGGVTVSLVEVTFRLDEDDDQRSATTQVCFEELDKVLDISHDSGHPWHPDWSKSVSPVENGVFLATLPPNPGWEIGKRFSVNLPNITE
jgi:hypothetical protein